MLDTACGTGGGACKSCGSDVCNKGVCGTKPPKPAACTTSSCGGCCQDDKCMSGSSQLACGQNGEVCKECTGGTACHLGTCKPCGLETCPNGCCLNCILGCCPPDVYAKAADPTFTGSKVASMIIPHTVKANTLTPKWSQILGSASAAQLTGGAITVRLMDDDAGILTDDLIGECTGTVQASDLQAGKIELSKTAKSCSGNVESVTILFNKI